MSEVILSTLNAKYIHCAFGLRYLMANLGPIKSKARILEFDINQRASDVAEVLLAQNPRIIGFGVYIWNVAQTTQVVALLKKVRPDVKIVIGGPEVSYEFESQEIVALADHLIAGEADLEFAKVCETLLRSEPQPQKIIHAPLPTFQQVALPYDEYNTDDVDHRIIYVEASRGCPFTCEFCLSSLDIPVRQAPLPIFLDALRSLLERGVKHFKFVDRTFNLNLAVTKGILEFFLEKYQPGHFFHFEMVPDRLPESLREVIAKFPAGALQFEVGIQTFNEQVGALIQRKQNYQKLEENLRFLRGQTGVHIHADLIAGLPGESLESFGAGFDRLIDLGPQEIQVGILKRLRGTPIVHHDKEWQMIYNPNPPYELLQNKLLDFATMQKLRRFARYWDLVGNSGNFVETTPLIWSEYGKKERSPFHAFMSWSEWLYERVGRADSIALSRLMEMLFEWLTTDAELKAEYVAPILWRDYQRGGRHDKPGFLKDFLPAPEAQQRKRSSPRVALPSRQTRHLA